MTSKKTIAPAAPEVPLLDDDELMEEGEEIEMGEVVHRPDGYYWQDPEGTQEFGPFATLELALADMESVGEYTTEPGETLQEAEDELGVADWIDPDTGELAEGQSTPHLVDD